ncbi:hypothetical protein C8Q77DRAFT_1122711, partial [Trametes polyzona]
MAHASRKRSPGYDKHAIGELGWLRWGRVAAALSLYSLIFDYTGRVKRYARCSTGSTDLVRLESTPALKTTATAHYSGPGESTPRVLRMGCVALVFSAALSYRCSLYPIECLWSLVPDVFCVSLFMYRVIPVRLAALVVLGSSPLWQCPSPLPLLCGS